MSFNVKKFWSGVPEQRLKPGDVWFSTPEVGGNHLTDVTAIRPVSSDGGWWRSRQPRPFGAISAAPTPAAISPAPRKPEGGVQHPPVRPFTAGRL